MAATNKLREELAQKFLEALNQGSIPWEACWSQGRPENAVTGKTYRGVNAMSLSYAADDRGYSDPRWCTYRQAQEKGWQVRKGEKSASVEYWAYYDLKEKKLLSWQELRDKLKADPDYEKHLQLRCRVYSVFNAHQIDGIPTLEQRPQTDIGTLRAHRDTLVHNMGIGYEEHGNRAYYSPSTDSVTLPPEASFDDTYSYMATFLHECGHASGASHRLNRDLSGFKGSESYAREELRAEIASAFTAQSLGLQLTPEQLAHHTQLHAAYVQHWAAILKDAPDELFRAIKAAEEISGYLIEKGEFDMEHSIQNQDLKEWHIVYESSDPLDGELTVVPAEDLHGRDVLQTFRCATFEEATKKLQRYEEVQRHFWDESNDPETQQWREDLTADEAAMVEQWDVQTAQGMEKLASDMLLHKNSSTMTVVIVEPGKEARIGQIPHNLESMQQAVGGSIEATYPFEDPVAVICNDDGKQTGLQLNRGLYSEDNDLYDIICGTFFVAGCGKEDFCSLSPELAHKYLEHYRSPEQFFNLGGKIVGFKAKPEELTAVLNDYLVKNAPEASSQPAQAPKLNLGG